MVKKKSRHIDDHHWVQIDLPVSVSVVVRACGLRDTEEDRLDFLDAHWAQLYYKHKRHYSWYRLVSEASIDPTQWGSFAVTK